MILNIAVKNCVYTFIFNIAASPCPSPYIPPHGKIGNNSASECLLRNNVPHGGVCQYECETGFFRVGAASVVCMENGKWNENFPDCRSKFVAIIKNTGHFLVFEKAFKGLHPRMNQ